MNSQRVLIVDDLAVNRIVLRHVLQALDCSVCEAASGPEALEQLANQNFDLVLLDIHMPDVTGFDVIENLRRIAGPNGATRVVAVTADVTHPHCKYIDAGFDDYLNKPVCMQHIAGQVAQAKRAELSDGVGQAQVCSALA